MNVAVASEEEAAAAQAGDQPPGRRQDHGVGGDERGERPR